MKKSLFMSASALAIGIAGSASADTGQDYIHAETLFGPDVLSVAAIGETPAYGMIPDQVTAVAFGAQGPGLLSTEPEDIATLFTDPGALSDPEGQSLLTASLDAVVESDAAIETHTFLTTLVVDEAGPLQDLTPFNVAYGAMGPGEQTETGLMMLVAATAVDELPGQALLLTESVV